MEECEVGIDVQKEVWLCGHRGHPVLLEGGAAVYLGAQRPGLAERMLGKIVIDKCNDEENFRY